MCQKATACLVMQFLKAPWHHLRLHQKASKSYAFESCCQQITWGQSHTSKGFYRHLFQRRIASDSTWNDFAQQNRCYKVSCHFPCNWQIQCMPAKTVPAGVRRDLFRQGGEGARGRSQTKGSLQANSHDAGKMMGCRMSLGLDYGLHSHQIYTVDVYINIYRDINIYTYSYTYMYIYTHIYT